MYLQECFNAVCTVIVVNFKYSIYLINFKFNHLKQFFTLASNCKFFFELYFDSHFSFIKDQNVLRPF